MLIIQLINFTIFRNQILRPNAEKQAEMFVGGLAEILTRAADGGPIYICMLGRETCFETNAGYGIDGFTEKVTKV